jgi:hypothetical protein
MQHLLVRHGVLPGAYYSLPEGEKVVIRTLYEDYMENAPRG